MDSCGGGQHGFAAILSAEGEAGGGVFGGERTVSGASDWEIQGGVALQVQLFVGLQCGLQEVLGVILAPGGGSSGSLRLLLLLLFCCRIVANVVRGCLNHIVPFHVLAASCQGFGSRRPGGGRQFPGEVACRRVMRLRRIRHRKERLRALPCPPFLDRWRASLGRARGGAQGRWYP